MTETTKISEEQVMEILDPPLDNEGYVAGRIYRAVSETELVELESIRMEGLKILILPEQVKMLKGYQKQLKKVCGGKPDLLMVLNGIVNLFTNDCDPMQVECLGSWILLNADKGPRVLKQIEKERRSREAEAAKEAAEELFDIKEDGDVPY